MIKRKQYKQRWTPGAIVQIDLGDGTFGYAQVLESPLVAFYDFKTEGDYVPKIDEILKYPIAFKVSVMKYCITQDWKFIGRILMDQELNKWPDEFRYDRLNKKYYIRRAQGLEIPANWEECQHLECAAVWEPHAIEQRLRDHFAGRPCWDIESMKPDWKFIPIKEFYKQYGYDFVSEAEEQVKSLK